MKRALAALGPTPRFGLLDRILTWLLAVVTLSSCAPAATAALNTALGDEAALVFAIDDTTACGDIPTTGLCFTPADEPALGVKLDIIAETVTSLDPACEAETYGATCPLGDVTSPTFIAITADHVTATAFYRRPDSNRILQEAARF